MASKYAPTFSSAKAALAKALLDGRTLNVGNCFFSIGLTNCSREISRMIEKPFEVKVDKIPRTGSSRYGQPVTWNDYKLNKSLPENILGVAKMREYIAINLIEYRPKKKDEEAKEETKATFVQPELF